MSMISAVKLILKFISTFNLKADNCKKRIKLDLLNFI